MIQKTNCEEADKSVRTHTSSFFSTLSKMRVTPNQTNVRVKTIAITTRPVVVWPALVPGKFAKERYRPDEG